GRTMKVGEYDVEAYRQVGWFYGKPTRMYAPDGRIITVGKNDVWMYKKVGWYESVAAARKTYEGSWYMYSSGRLNMKITIYNMTANSFKVNIEKMTGRGVNYNVNTAYFINNTTATATGTTYMPAYNTSTYHSFKFELENNKVYFYTDGGSVEVFTR
ncbi:MAG: hypothetical protein U0M60_09060, partial [Clostridia bacterium]|nr:hypothetical protein [Clostridia bacterium]